MLCRGITWHVLYQSRFTGSHGYSQLPPLLQCSCTAVPAACAPTTRLAGQITPASLLTAAETGCQVAVAGVLLQPRA